MLRKVVKRGFCVNNNDPIHKKNAENDHALKMWKNLKERDDSKIKGNFKDLFHDK